MNRMWQKALGAVALGLMLAAPLTGCGARPAPPAPRPEAGSTVDPDMSAAVNRIAASVPGAGASESVVIGSLALVAIQLNAAQPGGTEGGPLVGGVTYTDKAGASSGGGAPTIHGPGGSVGITPGVPGGGLNPGGATPGGSPTTTQAIPNAQGDQASQSGSNQTYPPGAMGAAPIDVMRRVADRIRAEFHQIQDVRFVTRPEEARRLAEIAQELQKRRDGAAHSAELQALAQRAVPAGTTQFNPSQPSQGQYPIGTH